MTRICTQGRLVGKQAGSFAAAGLVLLLLPAFASPASGQIVGPLGANTNSPPGVSNSTAAGAAYPGGTAPGANASTASSATTTPAAGAQSGGGFSSGGDGGVPPVTLGTTTPAPILPSTGAATRAAGSRTAASMLCPQADAATASAFGGLSCAP